MDLNQLWQNYKELILVIAGAAAALLFRDIIPGLWRGISRLGNKLLKWLNKSVLLGRFEKRYLEWLCEEHRFLQARGIRTRSPVAVELGDVYISLTLRRPSSKIEFEEIEYRGATDLEEVPQESQIRQILDVEKNEGTERLSIGEALKRYPNRMVILGGPGTGKTTLLSYLALKFAHRQAKELFGLKEEKLPILIRLRELSRTGLHLIVEHLPTLCSTSEIAKDCPIGFFEKRLEAGECILLLDGMDEVTTEQERRQVAEQIEDFVNSYPDNFYIITSRPAGYSSAPISGCTDLEICDFNDEDVENFARQWCIAVEFAVRGAEQDISETIARKKAEREAEELITAIRSNERVRYLTVNPLLLTIVAMVHRYRATLPKRRVDLYHECTEVLLGYWDEAKGIAGQLDWARKRRVLEPLAYWMHKRGRREAENNQVEQVVAEALPTVGEKSTSAQEFLNNVRERSGLLMERGLDIYGFSHLTFQEYLTASYLIDRGEDGLEELLLHLRDPWWHEVILLYAGMRDATSLISAMLAQKDDLFMNNLFLAARCLIDTLNIDPQVEDQVLSRLTMEFRAGEFEGIREGAKDSLIKLGKSGRANYVASRLIELLSDQEAHVREKATDALAELGKTEPGVVEGLFAMLRDQDAIVRRSAAYALRDLGEDEPNIANELFKLIGDKDVDERGIIVSIIKRLDISKSRVIEILLTLVNDQDADVRMHVSQELGMLREDEPGVVEELLTLTYDQNINVRLSATYMLGELGKTEPRVIERLISLLNDKEAELRRSAAFVLHRLGKINPDVVEELFSHLSGKNQTVRSGVASALGQLGKDDTKVVERLITMLNVQSTYVRRSVAYGLSWLDKADLSVAEKILPLLNDQDSYIRGSAAYMLGKVGKDMPGTVEKILPLLNDKDSYVRRSAATTLGLLGKSETGIIEKLLSLFNDQDAKVRINSATALVKLGIDDPSVVEGLIGLLTDQDANVRAKAASALGEMGKTEPSAIDDLLTLLSDHDSEVRRSAASALRQWGKAEPGVVEKLIDLINHPDVNVREGSAFALDPRIKYTNERDWQIESHVVPRLIGLLHNESELVSYLHDKEILVKDLAWWLLKKYSEETGNPIYQNDWDS